MTSFLRGGSSQHLGHRSQLDPGTRVQHDEHVVVRKLVGLHVHPQRFDAPLRIQKGQIGRRGLGIDDPGLLSETLEHHGQGQFTSQGVAIRTHVAGQQEAAMAVNDLGETIPANAHLTTLSNVPDHSAQPGS